MSNINKMDSVLETTEIVLPESESNTSHEGQVLYYTSPKKAIKLKCKKCVGGEKCRIKTCMTKDCPLLEIKDRKGKVSKKIIQNFCLEFCFNKERKKNYQLVRNCSEDSCPFYHLRTSDVNRNRFNAISSE